MVAITNKLDGDSSKTFLRRCLLAQAEQIDPRNAIFSLLLIGNSRFLLLALAESEVRAAALWPKDALELFVAFNLFPETICNTASLLIRGGH